MSQNLSPVERGAPIVQRLLQDIADPKISVAAVLRTAKIIATKLEQTDVLVWVNKELNGYDADDKSLPEYRRLRGVLKAREYGSAWMPVLFENPDHERMCSQAPIGAALGSIERELTDRTDGSFSLSLSPERRAILRKAIGGKDADLNLGLGLGQVQSVIDSVRNLLLDWALQLDQAGVAGIGMDFTSKEMREGGVVTKQVFHGNVGVVGNVTDRASVTNNQSMTTGLDVEAVLRLVEMIHAQGTGLPAEMQAAVQPLVQQIEQEAKSATPDQGLLRSLLGSLRAICEGAAGSLVASGIGAQIGLMM